MALTPSTMPALGITAPPFSLPDVVTGKTVSYDDVARGMKGALVMFICRHCPYVQHVKAELGLLGRDYAGKIGLVGISSNDAANYPDDSPSSLKAFAVEEGYKFPLLYDESQAVAKAYAAACTPDFFLYDDKKRLVYRGQLDDSRPGSGKPVTGKDLRAALDAVVAGKSPDGTQRPSMGCNIKWK